jgi:hypothetical protein
VRILILGSGLSPFPLDFGSYDYIFCSNSSIGAVPASLDHKIVHLCVEEIFFTKKQLSFLPTSPYFDADSALHHRLTRRRLLRGRSPLLCICLCDIKKSRMQQIGYTPLIHERMSKRVLINETIRLTGLKLFIQHLLHTRSDKGLGGVRILNAAVRLIIHRYFNLPIILPDFIKPSTGILSYTVASIIFKAECIHISGVGTDSYFFSPHYRLDRTSKLGHTIDLSILSELSLGTNS